MLEKKRDEMARILKSVDLKPIIPDGGCFMLADPSPLVKGTYRIALIFRGSFFFANFANLEAFANLNF